MRVPGTAVVVLDGSTHECRRLALFPVPTLRRCCVSELNSDLYHIGTRCAALEEFTVPGGSDMAQLSETVRSCKGLRRLHCAPLDSTAWMHLSTIPTLLEVKILASRNIHYPLDNLSFVTFLNLTTLSFLRIEVATVLTLIQHFEFPSLKELEMYACVLPWAEAEQLFRALSRSKASQTLEHINISCSDRTQEHSGDSLVGQLLCFKQLRTLRLSTHRSIYLDNDLLFEAMTSWPHIRSLSLVDWHPPAITFRGLFAVLRLCPHLQELQVSVDFRKIDIEPEAESFQHISLRHLIVGSSELEGVNVEAVARIIFCMLPAVDQVMCTSCGGVPRLWSDANRRLKFLRNTLSLTASYYIAGGASDLS